MAHGSPSCWLWMLFVQSVATVSSLFLVPSDPGILFSDFRYSFFFILILDYICSCIVQDNFLQKKRY